MAAAATGVVGLHGERVGLVDQVMIDPAAGRAAYVLVRTGGFLGLGAQWTPIPFAALRYDPAGPDWVLAEMPPASLAAAPQRSELPTEVDRQDLADLYRRYGADPYWH